MQNYAICPIVLITDANGEQVWTPKVAQYQGINYSAVATPEAGNTRWCLVLVSATTQMMNTISNDPEIAVIPVDPTSSRTQRWLDSGSSAQRQRLSRLISTVTGGEITVQRDEATNLREMLQAIGQRIDPTFNVDVLFVPNMP